MRHTVGEMEVVCACDQRYLPHAATMLCSLLEHNRVFRIHFIYSSIDNRELSKLTSLVTKYGSKIVPYNVVPADMQDLRVDKWASIAVYYRLLAPRLLPAGINRVLYLDCDIIVRRSLNDLWNVDITNHALAAVQNYDDEARKTLGFPVETRYFNSGVLLINLQFWRQNNIAEQAVSFIRNNPEKVQYWDQDALNATLVNQWIELSPSWNWQDWLRKANPESKMQPAIVHFIADNKPWLWSSAHPFKDEYREYRRKTPWWPYEEEGRPNLPGRLIYFLRSLSLIALSNSLQLLRGLVRIALPRGVRQWLRSRVLTPL